MIYWASRVIEVSAEDSELLKQCAGLTMLVQQDTQRNRNMLTSRFEPFIERCAGMLEKRQLFSELLFKLTFGASNSLFLCHVRVTNSDSAVKINFQLQLTTYQTAIFNIFRAKTFLCLIK
jgi:hypothetical protein